MRLYKYMPITEHTFNAILDCSFYFAPFNQLNDPCELTLTNCLPIELAMLRFQFHDPREPNGILCLSESWNNLHMWTQYAEGHRGIVVEFETDNDLDFFKDLVQVIYSPIPPAYREHMKVSEVISSKSVDSEKEKEWRVFGFQGQKPIKPEAIKKIIFGHRFPRGYNEGSNDCDLINLFGKSKTIIIEKLYDLYWNNKLSPHIEFYNTNIVHGTYSLTLSPPYTKTAIAN